MTLSLGCQGSSGEQKGRTDERCRCFTNRLEILTRRCRREVGFGRWCVSKVTLGYISKTKNMFCFLSFYHQWCLFLFCFFFAKMKKTTKKSVSSVHSEKEASALSGCALSAPRLGCHRSVRRSRSSGALTRRPCQPVGWGRNKTASKAAHQLKQHKSGARLAFGTTS